jgi:hypothetical protein
MLISIMLQNKRSRKSLIIILINMML